MRDASAPLSPAELADTAESFLLSRAKDDADAFPAQWLIRVRSDVAHWLSGMSVPTRPSLEIAATVIRKRPSIIEWASLGGPGIWLRWPWAVVMTGDERESACRARQVARVMDAMRAGERNAAAIREAMNSLQSRRDQMRNKTAGFAVIDGGEDGPDPVFGAVSSRSPNGLAVCGEGLARHWTLFGGNEEELFSRALSEIADCVESAESADPQGTACPRPPMRGERVALVLLP